MPTAAAQLSKVLVCATAKPAERVQTIPITARPGRIPKLAMRLGPGDQGISPLPDLALGDRLKVLVEVEVTTDCETVAQGDCMRQPYAFAPRVRARVLLSDDPTATAPAPGKALLLGEESAKVTQLEHHRVFVLEPPPLEIPATGLPWAGSDSYITVALDASHQDAKSNHVLLVGENEGGEVKGDKGRISIIRHRPGTTRPPVGKPERRLRVERLPLTKAKHVVLSAPLEHLAKGEQLIVGAMLESANRLAYKARISTRLVLGDSPTDTDAGKTARHISSLGGELAEHNGTNRPAGARGQTRKVGVLRVTKDASATHHLNLVAESADPVEHRTDGVLELLRGSLTVTRFPASWRG